jgi:hypothetical protein
MKAKKKTNRAAKGRGKLKDLENALFGAGKKFPALAGRYAITKVEKTASEARTAKLTESRRCVAWGKDPVTGMPICIRWE